GSTGLVGSAACRLFHEHGAEVAGIDNDMRSYFFGGEASTKWNLQALERDLSRYTHYEIDIRDEGAVGRVFQRYGSSIEAVVHAAAQPSHDWAAHEPATDFSVNATGTLVLLEAARSHCPDAPFAFVSTNKVYGDSPNRLPLRELETRWELETSHPFFERGIDETMTIDASTHSLFGVSKTAADLLVQEYGRYFGMKTAAFRAGCLTGGAHSGAELHGFLSYLMRCCLEGRPYRIFGYQGKQVRDNLHAEDVANMFWHFCRDPRVGEVYNVGGGRGSSCSVLEAIRLCESISGREMNTEYLDQSRVGDHIWYVSDISKFRSHYPDWPLRHDLRAILENIHDAWQERLQP
ncbi:MAG: NAD-dependent epimerase/dehydratase family protein, partial [Proteobacteria bacterium]|nr:NAD-dependent epimerase/dehydratase family protein [Pseudomonadota bacterium]